MRGLRTSGSRKEESQSYYSRNKERILIQTKEYALTHPEIIKKAGQNSYKKLLKIKEDNPSLYLWKHLKSRAKTRNLSFDLEVSDIIVPTACPALGIELVWNNKRNQKDNSPSVDRFDSSKGYIKGNINIISEKANRIKSNATIEEIRKVADWMEAVVGS